MPIPPRALPILAVALALVAGPAAARPASAPPPPAAPTTVAIELPPGADATPGALGEARPGGALPPAAGPGGERYQALAGFGAAELSGAPVTLLREGVLRGRRIAVYAVAAGGPGAAALAATLGPGARPLGPDELARVTRAPFATGAPAPDPAAAGPAWKITVSEAGMQSVDAAALAAAGLDLGALDPAGLRLRHKGREVALEEVRGPGGALAGLRFFAEPGDRWNAASVFWLTAGQAPGLRVAERNAQPAGAPVRTTAFERGEWRLNGILETRLAGPDGDRFFSADLAVPSAGAGDPRPEPAGVSAAIATRLPAAGGPATLTVRGDSFSQRGHTLAVTVAGERLTYAWPGEGAWAARLGFAAGGDSARVELLPAAQPDGTYLDDRIHVDSVGWELPVRLELGGQGARFVGQAGRAGYRLAGLPAGAAVYDVSDPERPARLAFAGDTFEDGGAAPATYLVVGPGTLRAPAVAAHAPVDLGAPLNAEAVYIAPRAFLAALEPLLAHRRAQGLSVAAVATEAIYDSWAYGQVDPEAIRSFLRFAAERWQAAPTTVALVGDGSSDPRDYLGRANVTWVPPYLAEADPWLGETACDTCYARLDGDDPLADIPPDLAIGRIPAKSAAELAAIVAKILAYEGDATPGVWRATVAFVADNPDLAGDFIQASERAARLQPEGARIARAYYDPVEPAPDPWRTPDPLEALRRSMGALSNGAAVVQYTGHGLQFQWGYTGPPLGDGPTDRQHLLGLFGVDELRNGTRLPVVLSMTCLTGSFQIPAFSGTSIDERLVARPDGGAIAAWGSTGLGVLFGHEALQRGFYRALWAPGGARLGELTAAGYAELFTTERCCQESISTFVLLGDPLTVPRARLDVNVLSLPMARR